MNFMQALQFLTPWFFSALGLIGTVLNTDKNKWGFVFWLFSNAYMCVVNWNAHFYAQAALFFIYFLLAIKGLLSWSKSEKAEVLKEENNG